MPGRLIYLMGPSGSGKDTILQGLCRLMGPDAYLAPRLITRPETHTERGATSVSLAEFLRLERSGALALSWRANGLAYGVPVYIDERLSAGCDVLVNGSRGHLPQVRKRYRSLLPVLLTVDAQTLRRRLVARGREGPDQIRERLSRNACYDGLADSAGAGAIMALDNSGAVEDAIHALYHYLIHTRTDTSHHHEADTIGYGQRRASPGL